MIWLSVGSAFLVLAAVSVAFLWVLTREPSYSVSVVAQTDALLVHWTSCGGGKTVESHSLSIMPADLEGEDDVCRLIATDDALAGIPLQSGWVYGSVPTGYLLGGNCRPLTPGRRYRVRVGGRIGGDAVFEIGKTGSVAVLERSCDRLPWWRKL